MSGWFRLASADAVSAPFFHDQTLVAVSMLVSAAGAYAYLELAERAHARAKVRRANEHLWRAASGAMLGFGVWATHFIGLMAFETPLKRGFDVGVTAGSAAVAMVGGAVAMLIAGAKPDWRRYALGGVCAAVGAIVMHYVGMHGMRIEAELSYRAEWVAATALGAFGAAVIAVWLAHWLAESWRRAAASFPVGAGMAGLHYVDTAATVITPQPAFLPPQPADPDAAMIATLASLAVIGLALVAAAFDRQRFAARMAARETTVVYVPEVSSRRDAQHR